MTEPTTSQDHMVQQTPFAADAQAPARPRVLIVDDQATNIALLERLIRSAGLAEVHTESDPRQAVGRCLEVDPDLVLLDLHMPRVDGFAVMSRLQATLPEQAFLPVLVLTADTTAETRDRALEAGAKDFLTKPFDRTEVLLRVRNLLETRALHADLRKHNTALQADLDRRAEHDRRLAARRHAQRERIDGVLSGDSLEMVFQPIIDLATGQVQGAEALARFNCEPSRPPNEWFDEADAVGRGPTLELAAVRAALDQLDSLPSEAFLAVNVSPATAAMPELASLLDGYPAERVVVELTEHARIDDYQTLLFALEALRGMGVRVAVDDAGAGYAGLQQILRLRPDLIKLDITLTRGIDRDLARRALGAAMVTFAHELGATVVAEGIETPDELRALQELDIPFGQGYHIAMPDRPSLVARRVEAAMHSH